MSKKEQLLKLAYTVTDDAASAEKYAEHLSEIFEKVIPEKIGDDFVRALAAEDHFSAVKAMAKYYRAYPVIKNPELSAVGGYNAASADNAVKGIAREVNVDWEFPNGEVDFLFDPTEIKKPVNNEWVWQFNRHGYWGDMARAYVKTGDEKYAIAFRKQLLKWIAQTYIPERWNGPKSAWRTIECGIRLLGTWNIAFDGFRRSESLDDVSLLLMIASMHRQAVHLMAHPTRGNWLMMEMNGVFTFSALFPEFSDSCEHRKRATELLLKELEEQTLPDGMHNELSPDYQSVVLNCASNFYALAVALGMDSEIPKEFTELIKRTVNAAIMLSTPAFTQPRTNDTYTIPTKRFTERTAKLLGDAPEYRFVNTCRAEGEPLRGETASAYLPYAGFAVMRSDWGADATYMCFDVGTLGMGHMHQDKLNINVYKGNEELIYDDGGGQYEISRARDYGVSGYDHNTVLVDGMAQQRGEPKLATSPIDAEWTTNDAFDYATATYSDMFGKQGLKPATHKREVRFCKPDFFCVSDTLTSVDGNCHDYEILFHLDTTSVKTLEGYKNGIISDYGRKYEVAIIPIDCECANAELSVVSAVTDPEYRGWYVGRNENKLHEATTVARKVSGVKDYRFNTLIFPLSADDSMPEICRNGKTLEITFKGKNYKFDLEALKA